MKIIDFDRKGNVVRFYLGADDCEKYWGDDWNDRPYEHNAGTVYGEFITGYHDITFPFDALVLEPSAGELNSRWSKEDMKLRLVPCLVVVPPDIDFGWQEPSFCTVLALDAAPVQRFYFGDRMEAQASDPCPCDRCGQKGE